MFSEHFASPAFTAIFDWDGVVIDSEECHREGWERLARELHRDLPAGYWEATFGRKNVEIISEILGWTQDLQEIARLADHKETLYREVVLERGVEPLAGVLEWLAALAAAGIP